jgi:hypothetical protein
MQSQERYYLISYTESLVSPARHSMSAPDGTYGIVYVFPVRLSRTVRLFAEPSVGCPIVVVSRSKEEQNFELEDNWGCVFHSRRVFIFVEERVTPGSRLSLFRICRSESHVKGQFPSIMAVRACIQNHTQRHF